MTSGNGASTPWWLRQLVRIINTALSLNRLGRAALGFFFLLSLATLGTRASIPTHLVLGQTAALWYNGFNDLSDLEIDRAAYAKSPYRKVLLNGAMTPRALWAWLVILSLASALLLVADVHAGLASIGLFGAGILAGVVYNLSSKHLRRPSIAKSVALDAIVGGPFYLCYAGLALASETRPDVVVVVATMGSLLGCGLHGNFIFAAKDLATDGKSAISLPIMLGSTLDADGVVHHSTAGKAYLWAQFSLLALVLGFAASHRHWFALAFAVRLLFATLKVCSAKATERDHKKVFVSMANWELFFLVSLHLRSLTLEQLALLTVIAGALILGNVGYFYDRRSGQLLMLRFGRPSLG